MNFSVPTILLDESRARANIKKMALKAREHKLRFRPHFKTHQSAIIGEWFRDEGVDAITVSSVTMAEYFFKNGWTNITIAFPFNFLELGKICGLNERCSELNILIENIESIDFIESYSKTRFGVYLKIDTGNRRTGIEAEEFDTIENLVNTIKKTDKLNFKGFLTHAGQTYSAKSTQEIKAIHNDSLNKLRNLKARFGGEVSIGDTPSCSIVEDFAGADEIRPGNFVFYDWMQYKLGSCSLNDIAIVMLCPVVAKHSLRNEIVIYGGAVHFSKDFIESNGMRNFGQIVDFIDSTWTRPLEKIFLKYLSQEHGIIKTTNDFFNSVKLGSLIAVIPVHSCLTAHLLKKYHLTDGRVIEMMN